MSVHIVVDNETMLQSTSLLQRISNHLRNGHGIEHTTIQIECEDCGHTNA